MRSDRGPAATDAPALAARREWLRRALALGTAACLPAWPRAAHASGLVVGQPAPPLVLHALDGRSYDTAALRGEVLVLTFWATWCMPCREELPLLSAYAIQHAQDGLQVLGFSLDDADALPEVRRFAAGLSFPVGLLGSAWAGGYGRIWHLPVNFTIDRAGRLADNGWDDYRPDWTRERLERVVTPLLRAKA